MAKLIIGLLEAKKGKIQILGQELNEESVYELRSHVGIVFQNPDNQLVATIVEEDVAFGPENLGVPPQEIRKRVDDALEKVGMSEYKRHAPHLLSGGQKQRLSIARTLSKGSKIVLFDEATSALDNKSQEYIKKTIDNLVKDHTIVIVAHRLSTIIDADIIFVVDNGKVVSSGTHNELLKTSDIYKNLYETESLNS